jgi:DNA-binding ferritin-like protein
MHAIGKPNSEEVLNREAPIMDRIAERLKELGGFTPEISKSLGWDTH